MSKQEGETIYTENMTSVNTETGLKKKKTMTAEAKSEKRKKKRQEKQKKQDDDLMDSQSL